MSFDVRPARGAYYILATDHDLPPLRHKLMQSTQLPCLPYATAADDGHEPWRRATQPPFCRAKPAPGPVPALLTKPQPSVAQDWDLMFNAVKARLRAAVLGGHDGAVMTDAVLECVEALEQLHRMLEDQRKTPGGR
ncbi:MAG: hypothetical protein IV097_12950 [Burkholderiaceae bacterium]|nr:hypothetical protein [Burkholderiaceae bacterium]